VHVLRLCSVFEPPDLCLLPPGARLDPVGGMQSHTAALTRSLDRLGVGQDVVTACRPGAARVERVGRAARIHRVGLPVRWGRQCWSAGAALLAPRLAARADLVHAHLGEDIAVLPVAVAAARLHGLPLVVTVHTSVAHTLVASDARSRRVKRVGGPIEEWAVPRAAAVLTLTERLRAVLVEAGAEPGRVHVVPSGFREWEYAAGPVPDPFPDAGRPRVGFVGRLAAQKDVFTLVRAAALLESPARIVLTGDGPDRAALEAEVARRGLADRVRFTGFVPHPQVAAVLAHTDVLVLPSRYEELGSVLLETVRAGVPIVASDTGGIPEVVRDGHNGLLCPPGDPAAFARAIDALLADAELRRRMGAAGRAMSRRFSWDALAPRVLAVYEAACGRPAGRRPVPARTERAAPALHTPVP
jgi:glycosyltransferase involved in cell wall biosynthesis